MSQNNPGRMDDARHQHHANQPSSPKGGIQGSNTIKPPEEWTTGDEPMTGAQASYLKTLSEEAGVDFDQNLTKAQASERIDALQKQTGRGQGPTSR